MSKGYVVITEEIHDPELMREYEQASVPSIFDHKGKVLVVDDDVKVLEGSWQGTRTVVVEFESVEAAQAWYDSEEYAKAKPLRQKAATCNGVILKGFEMPTR
jgi:uncharacterized protein (DUF1330 family)